MKPTSINYNKYKSKKFTKHHRILLFNELQSREKFIERLDDLRHQIKNLLETIILKNIDQKFLDSFNKCGNLCYRLGTVDLIDFLSFHGFIKKSNANYCDLRYPNKLWHRDLENTQLVIDIESRWYINSDIPNVSQEFVNDILINKISPSDCEVLKDLITEITLIRFEKVNFLHQYMNGGASRWRSFENFLTNQYKWADVYEINKDWFEILVNLENKTSLIDSSTNQDIKLEKEKSIIDKINETKLILGLEKD